MTFDVVVADDEPAFRKLLRFRLQRDGRFRVLGEASDGQEALELVEKHDPDLLLLDLAMPVMDGLEVLAKLQQQQRPRVVVLTGFEEAQTRAAVMEFGAASYLVKGPDLETLEDHLALRAAAGPGRTAGS